MADFTSAGQKSRNAGTGVYQYLDSNGDGSGTINLVGNYASAAAEFYYTNPNHTVQIERMIVMVEDTGNMSGDYYGSTASALTNGIKLQVRDNNGNILTDIMAGAPILTNNDWQGKCHDLILPIWAAAGNKNYSVRWTFSKSGKPIVLAPDWRLSLILNDDLTGLVKHRYQVQGKLL